MRHAIASYAREVSRLAAGESTTEASYYPAIKSLLEAMLGELQLRLDVRAATSEARRGGGTDAPDFAIYDGAGDFIVLFVEVKTAGADVRELASSRERNDQIGRYLASTGAVLLCTLREFAVATAASGHRGNGPVAPAHRRLSPVVELWPTVGALRTGARILEERARELAELLEEALTRHTPIAAPETLARVLARQARRAAAALPAQFTTAVSSLQEDFGGALGITFQGTEGEHFFRSSLVQTVYYGLFAGWLLHASEWRADEYQWQRTGEYLRIPFLAGLFHEIQNPVRLRELGLRTHLDAAAATLGRVDRPEFFRRLRPAVLYEQDEDGFASAIVYFYEPFLAAFDPELRTELGVWYTPPDIVRYQVRRVDRLLRHELDCPRGLADERVVVLDPACGTGAYLIETLRCIAQTLREEGVDAELAATLRAALERRILGFEILTAPFVVAHLQLYLLLAALGAAPDETHRAGVYLTNALTGWHEPPQVPLHFPELQQEREAAQHVKQEARIVVVLGNPPYRRFIGVAAGEEQALVDPYKGIRRDSRGRAVGPSELWTRWGVRKQLLDELYVRFFRLAEECIGQRADFGIVCYISNSSFLTGRSHPAMRESLLGSFDQVWIDNLHGHRLANERTPWGESCATIFDTGSEASGIKVGTCISTWLKLPGHVRTPGATPIHVRDFWGRAERKRQALLESLDLDSWPPDERTRARERPEGPREYETFLSSPAHRWKLLPYDAPGGYEDSPSLDQLFDVSSPGVNPNRGLDGSVLDTDRDALAERMRRYFSDESDERFFQQYAELGKSYAGYDPATARTTLRRVSRFDSSRLVPYHLFPLDSRWLYYETEAHLLNRPRPDIAEQLSDNEFLVVVNEARRVSETKPLLVQGAFDLHLFDVGAQAFVAERRERVELALDEGEPQYHRVANVAAVVWQTLATRWALEGNREGAAAKRLVRDLFRLTLAMGHAPEFQRDFAGSLAHDWLHLPIPRDRAAFDAAVALGEKVRILLDPLADAGALRRVLRDILGTDAGRLAQVARDGGGPVHEEDLCLTISHFGAAPGGWRGRAPGSDEPWRDSWGEGTGDLWLNDQVYLRHVPERAWRHELGGYQVVKKWLGYREARRRDGRPLTLAEKDHLRSIVQRLTAMATLAGELDAIYQRVAADAFTAEELGL